MQTPIELRLLAALRFDVPNGSSEERAIFVSQVKEAIAEIIRLRPSELALNIIRPFVIEIWQQHSDPTNNNYKDCDESECYWCAETKRAFSKL